MCVIIIIIIIIIIDGLFLLTARELKIYNGGEQYTFKDNLDLTWE